MLAEAITHYQRALKINPDKADTYNNLGAAYLQNGQVNDAIAQFQTAIKLNPDYAQAYYNLGNVLSQNGQMDQALVQYQMALTSNLTSPGDITISELPFSSKDVWTKQSFSFKKLSTFSLIMRRLITTWERHSSKKGAWMKPLLNIKRPLISNPA